MREKVGMLLFKFSMWLLKCEYEIDKRCDNAIQNSNDKVTL